MGKYPAEYPGGFPEGTIFYRYQTSWYGRSRKEVCPEDWTGHFPHSDKSGSGLVSFYYCETLTQEVFEWVGEYENGWRKIGGVALKEEWGEWPNASIDYFCLPNVRNQQSLVAGSVFVAKADHGEVRIVTVLSEEYRQAVHVFTIQVQGQKKDWLNRWENAEPLVREITGKELYPMVKYILSHPPLYEELCAEKDSRKPVYEDKVINKDEIVHKGNQIFFNGEFLVESEDLGLITSVRAGGYQAVLELKMDFFSSVGSKASPMLSANNIRLNKKLFCQIFQEIDLFLVEYDYWWHRHQRSTWEITWKPGIYTENHDYVVTKTEKMNSAIDAANLYAEKCSTKIEWIE